MLGKFRSFRYDENLRQYIDARNSFKDKCRAKRNIYYQQKLKDLTSSLNNAKSFWSKLKTIAFGEFSIIIIVSCCVFVKSNLFLVHSLFIWGSL